MVYESNKEKIYNYFFNKIYPQMDSYGIDYNKTISTISTDLKLSSKIVEEFFKGLFQSGKIKEVRIIDLTEEEIKKREEEKEKIINEAQAVIFGEGR